MKLFSSGVIQAAAPDIQVTRSLHGTFRVDSGVERNGKFVPNACRQLRARVRGHVTRGLVYLLSGPDRALRQQVAVLRRFLQAGSRTACNVVSRQVSAGDSHP